MAASFLGTCLCTAGTQLESDQSSSIAAMVRSQVLASPCQSWVCVHRRKLVGSSTERGPARVSFLRCWLGVGFDSTFLQNVSLLHRRNHEERHQIANPANLSEKNGRRGPLRVASMKGLLLWLKFVRSTRQVRFPTDAVSKPSRKGKEKQ